MLFVLGLLIAGGYFLLTKDNASSYTIPFIEVRSKEIAEKINGAVGGLKNYAAGQATTTVSALTNNLAGAILEKSRQATSQIIDGAKNETFQIFRQAVSQKVDNIGTNFGVDVQEIGKEVAPPSPAESPIAFGIQSGAPAYFTIKNRENEKIGYEADWQDGKKNSGEVAVGKSITLSHEWNSAGEYHLQFKIKNSKGEKIYQVSISIIWR